MIGQPPAWFVTLGGAMIVALLGYLLGLRRAKQELRWRATHQAYERIFGAVHDIYYWAGETHASNLMLPAVGRKKLADARHRFEDAQQALSSYVLVGGLVISKHSRDALDDLITAVAREQLRFEDDFGDDADYPARLAEHAARILTIVDKRVTELLREARSDLSFTSRVLQTGRRAIRAVCGGSRPDRQVIEPHAA